MRIGVAQRELSRNNGEHFLAPGYACVPRAEWLRRYHDTVLHKGAHFWYKCDDGLWWLGKIGASTTEDGVYVPGPVFARLGADHSPGALHDLNGGRTRFLVPADPRSRRVLSGDPT